MAELSFRILGVRVEPFAAVPTLAFSLRVEEASGESIRAIALRCQIQIEPHRRSHSSAEQRKLLEMFGEPRRWGETLKPLLWAHANLMIPSFQGAVEVELPMTCTYDFEVTAAKYFEGLEEGEIPLLFLFSGTLFAPGPSGFMVERVPWDKEAAFRLPVAVWREVMDRYFPGTAWIRLQRESLDALQRFKAERALPTWDDALAALLAQANVPVLAGSSGPADRDDDEVPS